MKILIADDSTIVRQRLIDMIDMMQCGDAIYEAVDYDQTIKGISDIRPDVLILDIRMPGGTGIDVLETIQVNTRPPMVIVFTNFYHSQYLKRCMQLGADYFFDKSIDIEKLVDIVNTFRVFPETIKAPGNANQ